MTHHHEEEEEEKEKEEDWMGIQGQGQTRNRGGLDWIEGGNNWDCHRIDK